MVTTGRQFLPVKRSLCWLQSNRRRKQTAEMGTSPLRVQTGKWPLGRAVPVMRWSSAGCCGAQLASNRSTAEVLASCNLESCPNWNMSVDWLYRVLVIECLSLRFGERLKISDFYWRYTTQGVYTDPRKASRVEMKSYEVIHSDKLFTEQT